jgi:16S rRNA (cytosine967-C5)-methyltransferase
MTRPIAPARRAAYFALRSVTSGRRDLPDALARARTHLTDERDQALAAEVVTGTLRWMGRLDAVITAFAKRPPERLDAEVLDILRASAYQLLHLERVPARAAVADAVELAREAHKTSAAGFVNAVLRRIDRERHALPVPERPVDGNRERQLEYLSIALSHPRWLVERWLDRFGFDATEAWVRFDNAAAPLTLRVNASASTREAVADMLQQESIETAPTRFAPHGLRVERGNPLRSNLAPGGRFTIQDEASQLVAEVVGTKDGDRVLDLCASPGGKSLAIADGHARPSLLVAADLRPRRVELLRDAVRQPDVASRLRIDVVCLDAVRRLPFADAAFDRVLVDAPCSGLGTLRRDPEIRWRRMPEDLAVMAETQRRILDEAARVVKPAGCLIYATCSSEPEENEALIDRWLAEHPAFAIDSLADDPRWQGDRRLLINPAGAFRSWPFAHGLESFFAVRLRRTM